MTGYRRNPRVGYAPDLFEPHDTPVIMPLTPSTRGDYRGRVFEEPTEYPEDQEARLARLEGYRRSDFTPDEWDALKPDEREYVHIYDSEYRDLVSEYITTKVREAFDATCNGEGLKAFIAKRLAERKRDKWVDRAEAEACYEDLPEIMERLEAQVGKDVAEARLEDALADVNNYDCVWKAQKDVSSGKGGRWLRHDVEIHGDDEENVELDICYDAAPDAVKTALDNVEDWDIEVICDLHEKGGAGTLEEKELAKLAKGGCAQVTYALNGEYYADVVFPRLAAALEAKAPDSELVQHQVQVGRTWHAQNGTPCTVKEVIRHPTHGLLFAVDVQGSDHYRMIPVDNLEDTITNDERIYEGNKASRLRREAAAAQAQQAEAERTELDGFGADQPAMKQGQILKTLMMLVRVNGETMSRRDFARRFVTDGGRVEHLAKGGRRLWSARDTFWAEQDFPATVFDYVEYLLAKKPQPTPQVTTRPRTTTLIGSAAPSPADLAAVAAWKPAPPPAALVMQALRMLAAQGLLSPLGRGMSRLPALVTPKQVQVALGEIAPYAKHLTTEMINDLGLRKNPARRR